MHVFNVPLEQIHYQLRREKYTEELWPKLLDIKTYQYTEEAIAKLTQESAQAVEELEALQKTQILNLWKADIKNMIQ
jgi:DNA topoisomerase-2